MSRANEATIHGKHRALSCPHEGRGRRLIARQFLPLALGPAAVEEKKAEEKGREGKRGKTNVRHSVAAFVLSLDRSEQILQLATLLGVGKS